MVIGDPYTVVPRPMWPRARITSWIGDRISGGRGIHIQSVSEDGRSAITVEFHIDRDIDGAATTYGDRVSTVPMIYRTRRSHQRSRR